MEHFTPQDEHVIIRAMEVLLAKGWVVKKPSSLPFVGSITPQQVYLVIIGSQESPK